MIPDLYEALSWTEAGVSIPAQEHLMRFHYSMVGLQPGWIWERLMSRQSNSCYL